jgi:hypothetical protein
MNLTRVSQLLRLYLTLLAFGLPVLAAGTSSNSPPVILLPYLDSGGRLTNGSHDWLRWKYSLDSKERAKWAQLMQWATEITLTNKSQLQVRLEALGLDSSRVKGGCGVNEVCEAILAAGFLNDIKSLELMDAGIKEAQPLATSYLTGIVTMEGVLGDREQLSLAEEFHVRRAGDQSLRAALTNQEVIPFGLSDAGAKVWRMLIWRAIVKRDLANTAWLKVVVNEQGWPLRSKIGKDASQAAWLLVQHADRDPAFQVQALRLMEPLVARQEVETKNYAMLYDRVFGELNGRQRYGTQMICKDGRFVMQPVEEQQGLEKRRQAVGLPSLNEQLKRFASRSC